MNSLKQLTTQKQLPNELKVAFKELKLLQHLRQAGIKRKFEARSLQGSHQ